MTDPDLIRLFIAPLEKLGLSYMVTGGVASVVYGDPRFTRDVDVVLELRRADVRRLVGEFSARDVYVPPLETIEEEAARPRGGHFNLIDRETGLRADVYVAGDDPLHAWAFHRRQRLTLDQLGIWVAPMEYVVIRKLQYFEASGSERHLRDVAAMLRISGDLLDRPALDDWIERMGLRAPLEKARAF